MSNKKEKNTSKDKAKETREQMLRILKLTGASLLATTIAVTGVSSSLVPLAPKTLVAHAAMSADNFYYSTNADGSGLSIEGYGGTNTEIVIPDEIDGKPVTRIAKNAFSSKTSLTSVTLGKNIKIIDDKAFSSLGKLVTVDFSKAENLEKIGANVFTGDGLLIIDTTALPSSLKYIGDFAFSNIGGFKDKLISIPDGVEDIGNKAFYGNGITGLNIVIGKNVRSIGDFAFIQSGTFTPLKHSFKSITFAEGSKLENIGDFAFDAAYWDNGSNHIGAVYSDDQFTDVKSLKLPDSLKTIGKYAFHGFTSLEELDLGKGVEEIGDSSFRGTSLTSLVIPKSTIFIGTNAFGELESTTPRQSILRNVQVLSKYVSYGGADYTFFGKSSKLQRIYGVENGTTERMVTASQATVGTYAFVSLEALQENNETSTSGGTTEAGSTEEPSGTPTTETGSTEAPSAGTGTTETPSSGTSSTETSSSGTSTPVIIYAPPVQVVQPNNTSIVQDMHIDTLNKDYKLNISSLFRGLKETGVTYSTTNSNQSEVTSTFDESTGILNVQGVSKGFATVTVQARDSQGNTSSVTFLVYVNPSSTTEATTIQTSPMIISDAVITKGQQLYSADLTTVFGDKYDVSNIDSYTITLTDTTTGLSTVFHSSSLSKLSVEPSLLDNLIQTLPSSTTVKSLINSSNVKAAVIGNQLMLEGLDYGTTKLGVRAIMKDGQVTPQVNMNLQVISASKDDEDSKQVELPADLGKEALSSKQYESIDKDAKTSKTDDYNKNKDLLEGNVTKEDIKTLIDITNKYGVINNTLKKEDITSILDTLKEKGVYNLSSSSFEGVKNMLENALSRDVKENKSKVQSFKYYSILTSKEHK